MRDLKYGQVTLEHPGSIEPDEEVIVFAFHDANLPALLDEYYRLCMENGSPEYHLGLIARRRSEVRAWQAVNPDKVRVPNSETSRGRIPG